ncbi:putative ammonium transporter 2 isoform X2 [Cloeon dipterum]|uniref:putative ammonium transporter 2 isoform X2 n=1 Tax=Cloeon dipterum TaxID=197152 RepID=UPI00321F8676
MAILTSASVENGTNASSTSVPWLYDLTVDDTTFVMTSSFIIFTMQTGFGLLESGCVSLKNEVNIMMKNVVDVVFGGLTYWAFGFGLSFGRSHMSLPFIGIGDFLVDPGTGDHMGPVFAAFLFQLSFATTATTIVSGAMAERCNFKAYCLFSMLNTVVYCIPAGWVWGEHGFLYKLGVVDIAGSGPVHLVGGTSALVATAMLGPRLGRYDNGLDPMPLGSPTNALMGLFMLWWGWLAFNSGSTFGISGHKWKYSARAAVVTMNSSFGGGFVGLVHSYFLRKGTFDIMDLINGVLGSLVSVTAGCYLYRPWEAVVVGAIGGAIACLMMPLWDRMRIDDPVGATSVHGCAGLWGVLAVGIFALDPKLLNTTRGRSGVLHGGGWYLLSVQALAALCYITWSATVTFIILWIVNKIIPLRMKAHDELLGADLTEHLIRHQGVGVSRVLSALINQQNNEHQIVSLQNITVVGRNTEDQIGEHNSTPFSAEDIQEQSCCSCLNAGSSTPETLSLRFELRLMVARPRGISGETCCIPTGTQHRSKQGAGAACGPPGGAAKPDTPSASPRHASGSPGGRQFGGVAHVAPCTIVPTPLCRTSEGHICQGAASDAGGSGSRSAAKLSQAQQHSSLALQPAKEVQVPVEFGFCLRKVQHSKSYPQISV